MTWCRRWVAKWNWVATMRSIEQLAQAAYEGYTLRLGLIPMRWTDLDQRTRSAWIAAAQAVRAEIEAVH